MTKTSKNKILFQINIQTETFRAKLIENVAQNFFKNEMLQEQNTQGRYIINLESYKKLPRYEGEIGKKITKKIKVIHPNIISALDSDILQDR